MHAEATAGPAVAGPADAAPVSRADATDAPPAGAPAAPLLGRALHEVLADDLREQILDHRLPPGAPIDELRLARHYGVSRTPVREALKLLCHEGLLSNQLRRGTTVTVLGEDELDEARALHELLLAHRRRVLPARPAVWGRFSDSLLHLVERRLRLGCAPSVSCSDAVRERHG